MDKEVTIKDVYDTFSEKEKCWIAEACSAAIVINSVSLECANFLRHIRDGSYSENQTKVVYFLLGKAANSPSMSLMSKNVNKEIF